MKTKAKGSFGVLLVAIIILLVGSVVINTTVNNIDGTSYQNNVTASNTATVYSVVPMLLVMGGVIAVIAVMMWYISTPERFFITNKKIQKIISFLDVTTYYFAYGLLCYAIFGTIATLFYLSYRLLLTAGETGVGIEIGKWIAIIIGFYFLTAGAGYLFKRFFWNKYQERKKEKSYIKNLNDLPKVG